MSRLAVVDAQAPPERLAALRVLTGAFVVGYLIVRLPVFVELRNRRTAAFDGEGVFALIERPMPDAALLGLIGLTLLAGFGYLLGWRFRVVGPLFALGLLVLISYRSSWGQLLHFEHLFVLHVIVVALAPSADAWSLDARRSSGSPGAAPSERYGWPIGLAAVITVVTYVIAGIAKLRYGGWEWMAGDTLQNHIAYAATRLDLLGGSPAPLAAFAVDQAWILPPLAGASVLVEFGAPIALLGGHWRNAWVAAAWLMHVAILVTMLIGFAYPLSLVAFAPFFALERGWERLRAGRRVAAPV